VTAPVLSVADLVVTTDAGLPVLDGVSITVQRGESLGLVGESGSGKTTLAHAILGFARPGLRLASGSVRVVGEELVGRRERELRALRGRRVSYVPQDPATALNPSIRIGRQIAEICRTHAPECDASALVPAALERVGLPSDPDFRGRFPHQLSGGQQQRVAIAMAFSCNPPLIVLDEPTTGLDVVTQARILEEVRRLQHELEVALVYVSHDLAAVASVTDRVAVMYAGGVVERAPTDVLTRRPRHPYTRGLVSSVPDHRTPRRLVGIPGVAAGVQDRAAGCSFAPRCELRIDACHATLPPMTTVTAGHDVRCLRWERTTSPSAEARIRADVEVRAAPLLAVSDLVAEHRTRGGVVIAADRVCFGVSAGECLALVGESGSGKTTIARCIVGLHERTSGEVRFDGAALAATARRRMREQRRRIQVVFQNPYESLNPRQSVLDAVSWPARALRGCSRREAETEVATLLERVRLPASTATRYPGELSGGERQRVAIARALAAHPDLLVCDEVTSALDVSVQAAALDLVRELQVELELAVLFITHDLGVVASIADRVLVLERGTVVEQGDVGVVLGTPAQPYTQRLIAAAPSISSPDPVKSLT
jgi:peptide/nickel transport system ATP-binding protein